MLFVQTKKSNNSNRNDLLKLFAMFTMLIDHIGYLFFPNILLFRTIGRMAFPIFAYHLSIGYSKTSNLRNYIIRLFIFGLITYIPYSFFNPKLKFNPFKLNILFTLGISLIFIYLYDNAKKHFTLFIEKKDLKYILFSIISIIFMFFILIFDNQLSTFFPKGGLEYGAYGILLVLIFHLFKDKPIKLIISFIILNFGYAFNYHLNYLETKSLSNILLIFFNNNLLNLSGYFFQARSIFSLFFIYIFKNIDSSFKLNKWIGYLFYPGHIAILVLIKYFIIK
ncbi:MAG: TraX family protein [Bacillota bacterium]